MDSLTTSERVKRIVERLHTPFSNEERWAIVQEELDSYREEILRESEGGEW